MLNGKLSVPEKKYLLRVPEVDWSLHRRKRRKISGDQVSTPIRNAETPTPVPADGENPPPSTIDTPKLVRGRPMTDAKPKTFNRLWGEDEQRRLEELLVKHPHEEVGAHRWAKIARDLGTRTPKQVSILVQHISFR